MTICTPPLQGFGFANLFSHPASCFAPSFNFSICCALFSLAVYLSAYSDTFPSHSSQLLSTVIRLVTASVTLQATSFFFYAQHSSSSDRAVTITLCRLTTAPLFFFYSLPPTCVLPPLPPLVLMFFVPVIFLSPLLQSIWADLLFP